MVHGPQRMFFAIEIPESVRESLRQLQRSLQRHPCNVRWVRPERIHITLKFLGETDSGNIDLLERAAAATAAVTPCFTLSAAGTGAFPDTRRPRVLWAGIGHGKDVLVQLAADLDRNLAGEGFTAEKRPYSPHLTLGRVVSGGNIDLIINDMPAAFQTAEFDVTELKLFTSELKPAGPVYRVVNHFKLKG